MYVRRRRLTRKMIIDPDPPSKPLPYELTVKVLRATLVGVTNVTHSYVEVFLDHTFLDRTSTGKMEWNHKLVKKAMQIDPELTLTFVLYTKKTSMVSNPFQTSSAPVEMVHRGTAHFLVREFLKNLTIINRQEELDLIAPATGQKCGTLGVRLDLFETTLFGVVPAADDSLEELRRHTEEGMSTALRYDISAVDNDEHAFLKVLVGNVIEGRDVLIEGDVVDIVSEAAFILKIAQTSVDDKPRPNKQGKRYPNGKPRYSKLITLPSSLVDKHSEVVIRQQLKSALDRELQLRTRNEQLETTIPALSSVFDTESLAANAFDFAYQPHSESKGASASELYYDLVVYCHPEDSDDDVAHVLRWTSYFDYVITIRELVKIQHQYHQKAPASVVRHTSKVQYGTMTPYQERPPTWLPVTFTVDSEAEFLVIRESRVAHLQNSHESLDKIISFEQVSW